MSVPSLSLEGKVALVTGSGGTRGMGRVIALTFAEAGADIVLCDIHATGESYDMEANAEEIRKLGRRVLAVQADITREDQVISLMNKAVKELGKIDILVNNAGTSAHDLFLDLSMDIWDRAMNINLRAVYMCSREAAKFMVKQGGGNIVNIASIGGLKYGEASAYGIAKAGVLVMTGWAARELAQHNIRVNAIAPGGVATDFGLHRIGKAPWQVRPEAANRSDEKPTAGGPPLGRLAEPQDIANAALFLASDASRIITGEMIIVDGGTMLV